ncbi:MAG TPA: shikimate dehydrogenase [Balneolales bacterium]|nr:shikimate dehydrogenase [Balneolales bacterium]
MELNNFLLTDFVDRPFLVLIGHPVSHSLSPLMHNTAATYGGVDLTYTAVDVASGDLSRLPALLNHPNFRGANVTIPHKSAVIPMLDQIEDTASDLGAVNTIYRMDGQIGGTNTDVYGFMHPLRQYSNLLDGGEVVVFGSGGASRAVLYALGESGVSVIYLVSRSPDDIIPGSYYSRAEIHPISYDAWTYYAEDCSVIVNTTPLGMHPEIDASPVRNDQIKYLTNKICYDLVYNPAQTVFLQQAERAGATSVRGLEMLVRQGSRSWEIWTGKPFPVEEVQSVVEKYLYGQS